MPVFFEWDGKNSIIIIIIIIIIIRDVAVCKQMRSSYGLLIVTPLRVLHGRRSL